MRCNPSSTESLLRNLNIEGYILKLPMSWYSHGQARIIMYVREGVNVKIKPISQNDSDLPSISCEIRLGKEKSTFVNFFYREWTSGVSGQSDPLSQDDRL